MKQSNKVIKTEIYLFPTGRRDKNDQQNSYKFRRIIFTVRHSRAKSLIVIELTPLKANWRVQIAIMRIEKTVQGIQQHLSKLWLNFLLLHVQRSQSSTRKFKFF